MSEAPDALGLCSAEAQRGRGAERSPASASPRLPVSAFKETEVGPIPADWDVVPFEHAILKTHASVGKVKRSDYRSSGAFPVVDQGQELVGGYWDETADAYDGPLPVVVFGDHTRIFKFVDFQFVQGADGTKVLLPDEKSVDPFFFYLSCLHLDIPSKGYSRHYKLLKEQFFPLPPLPEQRRIAGALRTIQDAIAAQDDVIAAARELKRSLMERLFTYGPGRDPAPTKETEIGEIPEHWEARPARDILEQVTDGTHDTPGKLDAGVPLVTSRLLKGGEVRLDLADYFISKNDHKEVSKRSGVGAWDVLYSMIGTIGEVALVTPELPEFSIKNVALFRSGGSEHLGRYVAYWLQTAHIQGYIAVRASGTSQKYVPLGLLRALPFVWPPQGERHSIVADLVEADSKIAAEEQRKAALEELFRSTLEQLMTGQIRLSAESQRRGDAEG